MLSALSLSLGCTDTLGWKNQWGDSCWTYSQRCRDGQFFAESWTQGADYNFPEKNCCACGKKQTWGPGYDCGNNERTYCDELQDLGLGVCLLVRAPSGHSARRRPARRPPRVPAQDCIKIWELACARWKALHGWECPACASKLDYVWFRAASSNPDGKPPT